MANRVYELAKRKFPDHDEWGVDYSTDGMSHQFWVWQGPGFTLTVLSAPFRNSFLTGGEIT